MSPFPLKYAHSLLFAWLAFFTTACDSQVSVETKASSRIADTSPGMVWRVQHGKAYFFLAGSIHLLKASDYPLPAPYEMAWSQSQHILLEIAPGEASLPSTRAALPALIHLQNTTLPETISPDTWKELTQWAQTHHQKAESYRTYTPWMASIQVTLASAAQLGFLPEYGLESHFWKRLVNSSKTSEGLETGIGQMSLFQKIPPTTQEAMLKQALQDADTLSTKAATLANAWRTGDRDAIADSFAESFSSFPEVRQLLLDDRNASWMPRLEALLAKEDTTSMVIVGAGHLCGPNNLIDLLQAKGYSCEAVTAQEANPVTTPRP